MSEDNSTKFLSLGKLDQAYARKRAELRVSTCIICMDSGSCDIALLCCGKGVHVACLDEWLYFPNDPDYEFHENQHNSSMRRTRYRPCPNCRKRFKVCNNLHTLRRERACAEEDHMINDIRIHSNQQSMESASSRNRNDVMYRYGDSMPNLAPRGPAIAPSTEPAFTYISAWYPNSTLGWGLASQIPRVADSNRDWSTNGIGRTPVPPPVHPPSGHINHNTSVDGSHNAYYRAGNHPHHFHYSYPGLVRVPIGVSAPAPGFPHTFQPNAHPLGPSAFPNNFSEAPAGFMPFYPPIYNAAAYHPRVAIHPPRHPYTPPVTENEPPGENVQVPASPRFTAPFFNPRDPIGTQANVGNDLNDISESHSSGDTDARLVRSFGYYPNDDSNSEKERKPSARLEEGEEDVIDESGLHGGDDSSLMTMSTLTFSGLPSLCKGCEENSNEVDCSNKFCRHCCLCLGEEECMLHDVFALNDPNFNFEWAATLFK